jgi:hypothetical protein
MPFLFPFLFFYKIYLKSRTSRELIYSLPSDKNLKAKNQAADQKEINQKINKLWAEYSQQVMASKDNLETQINGEFLV